MPRTCDLCDKPARPMFRLCQAHLEAEELAGTYTTGFLVRLDAARGVREPGPCIRKKNCGGQ